MFGDRRLPPEQMYPAGVPGVTARTLQLDSGERVRVAESGPPNGIPVLLVHGWGGCLYSFRSAIASLAAAGHHAIAVDLHGHGLSTEAEDRDGYDLPAMVEHLGQIVRALGIEELVIVAHSMSGRVAIEYASAHPQQVRGLALLAAAGVARLRVPVNVVQPVLALAAKLGPVAIPRFAVKAVLRAVYGTRQRFTERDVDEYWAPSRFPRYGRALHALLRDFDWRVIEPERIALLPMPVVIVEGARDPLLGLRRLEEFKRRVAPKRVVSLARTGHIVTDEAAAPVDAELLALVALSAKRVARRVTSG
jgi:pimeloyl-ACP methyl ester carboxylesterase